jgi:hypothetical protein
MVMEETISKMCVRKLRKNVIGEQRGEECNAKTKNNSVRLSAWHATPKLLDLSAPTFPGRTHESAW